MCKQAKVVLAQKIHSAHIKTDNHYYYLFGQDGVVIPLLSSFCGGDAML